MKNSKSTKPALVSSILSLILCTAMLIGTTLAWFTDSVTSAGNKITAGNLEVTMEWKDGTKNPSDAEGWQNASQNAIFNNDKWEPGYTEARHVRISNQGNLALKYEICIVANGEVSDLAEAIDVYYIKDGRQIANRGGLEESEKIGTLADVLAKPYVAKGHISGMKDNVVSSDIATIALKMQENAGNEYQGMSIGTDFSIQLTATQYIEENDSFGNDYDENANAQAVFGKDIVDQLNDPGVSEVVAGGNIDMNKKDFQESNGNCTVVIPDGKTLDLNQNTVIRPEGGQRKRFIIQGKNNRKGKKRNGICRGRYVCGRYRRRCDGSF